MQSPPPPLPPPPPPAPPPPPPPRNGSTNRRGFDFLSLSTYLLLIFLVSKYLLLYPSTLKLKWLRPEGLVMVDCFRGAWRRGGKLSGPSRQLALPVASQNQANQADPKEESRPVPGVSVPARGRRLSERALPGGADWQSSPPSGGTNSDTCHQTGSLAGYRWCTGPLSLRDRGLVGKCWGGCLCTLPGP